MPCSSPTEGPPVCVARSTDAPSGGGGVGRAVVSSSSGPAVDDASSGAAVPDASSGAAVRESSSGVPVVTASSGAVVLAGTVQLNDTTILRAAQMATLDTAGSGVAIEANNDAKVLLLAGEPIDEPVVGYGPFVMNSREEIVQAIEDFNGGKFGRM